MKKTCVKFKDTASGKRCARFSTNEEKAAVDHSMVELSLKGYGLINKSVNSTDVLAGAAIGLVGSGVIKWGIKQLGLQDKLPVIVQNWMPLLGSTAAGSIAYALERKSNKSRAEGHLVGAIAAGASAQAWGMLKAQYPEYFGDVVALRFAGYNRRGMGVLVRNPTPRVGPGALGGVLFNNPQRRMAGTSLAGRYADRPEFAGLAAAAMGDDRDGLEELMD